MYSTLLPRLCFSDLLRFEELTQADEAPPGHRQRSAIGSRAAGQASGAAGRKACAPARLVVCLVRVLSIGVLPEFGSPARGGPGQRGLTRRSRGPPKLGKKTLVSGSLVCTSFVGGSEGAQEGEPTEAL